jgi:tetratricopeptide (TPR) repeat protein
MELVQGAPITAFADQHDLTPRQRLELFVGVCRAVQHAHQKGIIHRDLKPSNVLVTLTDGVPIAKVIDFGVAKAVGQRLTAGTLDTAVGTLVGTLEYMAPEQAELSAVDVDTRADVYSLGVLLYELLTGSTPLEKRRLRQTPITEVLRLIREEEAPRPSTRVLPPRIPIPRLRELDWVVMKALEKDRDRRYPSAEALARDVERYLADEPVEACPPSAGYRLRKLVRRHRAGFAAAGAFALLLIGATGLSAWLAWRAKRAEGLALASERAAVEERDEKEKARAAEVAQKVKAVAAEADTKAFSDFLVERILAASRPEGVQLGVGVNVTLAEALQKAEPHLARTFANRPRAEAAARQALGVTWRNLGWYDRAEAHLRRAVDLWGWEKGENCAEALAARNSLAVTLGEAGRIPEAIALFQDTLRRETAKLGPDHPDTLNTLDNLAGLYQQAGDPPRAVPLFEETLRKRRARLGPLHVETLLSLIHLAAALDDAGQRERARTVFEQGLRLSEAALGRDHPHTLLAMRGLGFAYHEAGRPDRAVPLLERALARSREKLGPDHADTLAAMTALAMAYQRQGKLDLALPLHEEAAAKSKERLGPHHPHTLRNQNNLALAYHASGQPARALAIFEAVLEASRSSLGADHPQTLGAVNNLGAAYFVAGKFDQAVPLLEQAAHGRKAKLGADHPDALASASTLAAVGERLLAGGNHTAAQRPLRAALAILTASRPDGWETAAARALLGTALLASKKYPEAERLLLAGYAGLYRHADAMPYQLRAGRLREVAGRLLLLYEATGRPERAALWRKKHDSAGR